MNPERAHQLQDLLCTKFCAEIKLAQHNGLWCVDTPFHFPDGDAFQIYLQEMPSGGLRITDAGHTLMHMSYEFDTEKLRDGKRREVFTKILGEYQLRENDGELYMEVMPDELASSIFTFGQGLTGIYDTSLFTHARVESTFYEDLKEELLKLAGAENVDTDYLVPGLPDADLYPIDFQIKNARIPFFIFGIPSIDKAQKATIIFHILHKNKIVYESLMVFNDVASLGTAHLRRLMNVGGEMVSSLVEKEELARKVKKRLQQV